MNYSKHLTATAEPQNLFQVPMSARIVDTRAQRGPILASLSAMMNRVYRRLLPERTNGLYMINTRLFQGAQSLPRIETRDASVAELNALVSDRRWPMRIQLLDDFDACHYYGVIAYRKGKYAGMVLFHTRPVTGSYHVADAAVVASRLPLQPTTRYVFNAHVRRRYHGTQVMTAMLEHAADHYRNDGVTTFITDVDLAAASRTGCLAAGCFAYMKRNSHGSAYYPFVNWASCIEHTTRTARPPCRIVRITDKDQASNQLTR
ncbi:MAG: GNAT family N-acetyltransferase [Pseudomonadota bacterium]